jgi:hypothetical protein
MPSPTAVEAVSRKRFRWSPVAVAGGAPRHVVDLSHPITDGTVTYPGLPGPQISDHLTRAASEEAFGRGVTFHIGRISMVANTGTYLDSPYHRYAGGDDLATLSLQRLVDLDTIVVRVAGSGSRAVDVAQLAPARPTRPCWGLAPRSSSTSATSTSSHPTELASMPHHPPSFGGATDHDPGHVTSSVSRSPGPGAGARGPGGPAGRQLAASLDAMWSMTAPWLSCGLKRISSASSSTRTLWPPGQWNTSPAEQLSVPPSV